MPSIKKSHTFEHPFDVVACSFWQKYPNERNSYVVAIDTFHRHFDYENQRLVTYRLVQSRFGAPRNLEWLARLFGFDRLCFGVERCEIDLKRRSLNYQARNVSGAAMVLMTEAAKYRAEAGGRTRYSYKLDVEATAIPFHRLAESKVLERVKRNSAEGLKAVEEICERIAAQRALEAALDRPRGVAAVALERGERRSRRLRRLSGLKVFADRVLANVVLFE